MIDEVAARNDHDRAAVADRVEPRGARSLPVTGRGTSAVARAIDIGISTAIEVMRYENDLCGMARGAAMTSSPEVPGQTGFLR